MLLLSRYGGHSQEVGLVALCIYVGSDRFRRPTGTLFLPDGITLDSEGSQQMDESLECLVDVTRRLANSTLAFLTHRNISGTTSVWSNSNGKVIDETRSFLQNQIQVAADKAEEINSSSSINGKSCFCINVLAVKALPVVSISNGAVQFPYYTCLKKLGACGLLIPGQVQEKQKKSKCLERIIPQTS